MCLRCVPRAITISVVCILALAGCKKKKAEPRPAPATSAADRALPVPGRKPMSRPPRPPTLIATAFTSSVAEASNTSAAWTALAEGYEAELGDCKTGCRELAYEMVLARNRALKTANLPRPKQGEPPGPLPPEVQANVDALDAYVERLDPTDDEVAPMKFLAANALWQWNQEAALPRLQQLLQEHRDDATAEYAANQLLHFLMEQGRIDELRAWVAELSADETFLANKPELRATLEKIRELLAQQP